MEAPNNTVHQYITKEAEDIWLSIPNEIKYKLADDINDTDINGKYDANKADDIITGSAEEDLTISTIVAFYSNHFWDPDTPNTGGLGEARGKYSQGLLSNGESSFTKAYTYWTDYLLPYYTGKDLFGSRFTVDQDQSYYYLGRVAHLLEDAASVPHVHLDGHLGHSVPLICVGNADCDDSILEEFTAQQSYFNNTQGKMNVEHYVASNYSSHLNNFDILIDGFSYYEVSL